MSLSKSKLLIVGLLFGGLILFTGCGREDAEESKSMEEIQNSNGVPVSVVKADATDFSKHLKFFTQLKGIKQTTSGSMIGGRIEKINYKPGDWVKKDAVVVEYPEDAPSSQLIQYKASYTNAETTYKRMKALYEVGETSKQNLDNAETQFLVAKRNYETAQQTMYVKAPYDGVITQVFVTEGESVDTKIPLFTTARLNKMLAKVYVTENEMGAIKVGQKAEFTFNGKKYDGKVTEVSLSKDPMHKGFEVQVVFENEKKELPIGLTIELSIITYENESAVVIPRKSLKKDSKGQFVYYIKNDKAVKTYVKLGEFDGLDVEVLEGLTAGSTLITSGSKNLEDGKLVRVIK